MITLEPATKDDATVLQNLFEFYVYDFSELLPVVLKPSGRFEVSVGDAWWTKSDHFPFFIRHDGQLCGMALIRRGSRLTEDAGVMDVAEFFVVRGARRRRIGERAAHSVFRAFAGRWEVRVRRTNVAAFRFWSRVVESWTARPATSAAHNVDGVEWDVFRFESP